MGLETGNRIQDLVPTNPAGATDFVSQGDDHIRLIKACIQGSFPSLGANAVTVSADVLNGVKNASNLDTGTIPDARLSSNVPLKNAANVFTANIRIAYTGNQEQLRLSHDNALLSFYNAANSARSGYLWFRAGSASQIWVEANQALQIGTNNVVRMELAAAGNVSILAPSSGPTLTLGASNSGTTLAMGQGSGMAAWTATDGTVSSRYFMDGAGAYIGTTGNFPFVIQTNSANRFIVGDGVRVGTPTGGDKGAGTINAAGEIYVNNVSVRDASGINAGTLNNARLPSTISVTTLQQGGVNVASLPAVTSTSTTLAAGQAHYITGNATLPALTAGQWVSIINNSGSAITISESSGDTTYWTASGASVSSFTLAARGRLFAEGVGGGVVYVSGDITGAS